MWKKAHESIQRICESMEIVIAAIVAIVLIAVMILWMPGELGIMFHHASAESLMGFLEQVMHFVVAIEFIKLMCKPTTENLIEVLEFLIARHMIVGDHTVNDLFMSTLAIVLLIAAKKMTRLVMFYLRRREEEAKREGTWNFSEEDEKPNYEYEEAEESYGGFFDVLLHGDKADEKKQPDPGEQVKENSANEEN